MPPRLDLTGKKFGKLTIISFNRIIKKHFYWNCICECGKNTIVDFGNLKSGHTKSCGCYHKERIHKKFFKDITGQKFGRLTVISFDKIKNKKTYWNCICSCGQNIIVAGGDLKSGKTQSCGCLQKEKIHETIFKDLAGQKFKKLTVLNFYNIKNKRTYWNCLCECGKNIIVDSGNLRNGHTQSCGCYRIERRSGENSNFWKNGISFEPYCPKFNKDLKKRVRSFFNNECIICSKTKEENKKALSVHHVEYNKKACCDGKSVHFAALCCSCHGKTNKDRERWEAMLHRIIDEIYDGRSYYTKEEYKNLLV